MAIVTVCALRFVQHKPRQSRHGSSCKRSTDASRRGINSILLWLDYAYNSVYTICIVGEIYENDFGFA